MLWRAAPAPGRLWRFPSLLVAIVCAFTGLCYAELASMIPIAGSAYTYTYATMGELVAWIIGWDLILEYAVSNMAVCVGFAAHIVDFMDWFGMHPSARWISPAFLPSGLTDLQGNTIYQPGWHLGFNFPAFFIVLILTIVLVRGIRESAGTNNIMVLLKITAILVFIVAGSRFIHPGSLASVFSQRLVRRADRRQHHLFYLHWLRFRFDRGGRMPPAAARRPIGILATLVVCTVLYIGVAVVLTGLIPWQTLMDDAAPVVNTLKKLSHDTGSASLNWVRLVVLCGRHDGHDLLHPGLPARAGAGLVCHVPRPALSSLVRQGTPALSHSGGGHLGCGLSRRHSQRDAGHWHAGRLVEHRHAVCLRAGFDRGADFALS